MYLQTEKDQPLIGIIGLPRSGTTILANLLNSCENGFCVVEPIWATECGVQAKEFKTKKTDTFSTIPTSDISAKLRTIISEKDYNFGAIKETYRSHQSFCAEPVIKDCDIIICSVRDPLSNFSSWRRTGWGGEYDACSFFIKNYLSLYNELLTVAQTKPVIPVIHENLCVEQEKHFNQCLGKHGKLIGDLTLDGIDSNYCMGDGRAASSKAFTESNCDVNVLSPSIKTVLSKTLCGIYDKMKHGILLAILFLVIWFTRPVQTKMLTVADLDKDGKMDIVVTKANCISVLMNTGKSQFKQTFSYTVSHAPSSVSVADCDGDGIDDIIFGYENGVGVLFGNGDGTFKSEVKIQ